jgi:hypothetical protein
MVHVHRIRLVSAGFHRTGRGGCGLSCGVGEHPKGRTRLSVILISDDGSVLPGSTSPTHRPKKQRPVQRVRASQTEPTRTRTAAHALFGPPALRFKVMRIRVSKEGVSKLAANGATLRYTITARMDAAAAVASMSFLSRVLLLLPRRPSPNSNHS